MGYFEHRPDRPKPWRARFRGPDGRNHSKSFKRKVDAERWLRGELARLDRGEWVDPAAGSVTFAAWSVRWLDGRLRLAEKTRADYQGILNSRILPTFGDIPVSRVRRDRVEGWIADMDNEGLSASRIRNCYNVLASCLDGAVREGIVGRNHARDVELPAQPVREHRFLDAAEVARLASAAPSLSDEALVLVFAYGGLRWGEAVALTRGRVNGQKLHVVAAATEVSGRLVFGDTKTHRRRTVHVPAFVSEVLTDHLRSSDSSANDFAWTALRGGPLRYTAYRSRVWDDMVREAGLDGLTPHDLRHTCASLMRAAGADVVAISSQLGHRSPVVTLGVYTHLFEDAYDDVMDRLDKQAQNLALPNRSPRSKGRKPEGQKNSL